MAVFNSLAFPHITPYPLSESSWNLGKVLGEKIRGRIQRWDSRGTGSGKAPIHPQITQPNEPLRDSILGSFARWVSHTQKESVMQ